MKRTILALVLASSATSLAAGCASSKGPPPRVVSADPRMPANAAPASSVDPDAFRTTRPAPGAIVPHDYPLVETGRLPNGISLYVVNKPAGVVSLSLVAGSRASRLPLGKSGVSAFTVRMMTEGTSQKNALRLAEAAESLGSTLEQSASRDYVRLGITTLPENLKDGLALLAEVTKSPSFPAADIERVRSEWQDSIEGERQNPSRLSALVGLRLLLGDQVGAPVNGSRQDIAALKRQDLVKFHHDTFAPDNLALIAVGDVTLASLTPVATQLLGGLRGKTADVPAPAPAPAAVTANVVYLVDRPAAVQSAVFVAQPFPRRSEPGHEARELLTDLLGGLFTSRLNSNLREAHAYTYGARAVQMATQDWGALAVMTSVRTDVTAEALGEALSELHKIGTQKPTLPPTDEEIARARVDLKQQLGTSLADTGEIADNVETLFVQALPADYFKKYPSLLDGHTASALTSECVRIDPSRAVIVIAGDRAVVEAPLKAHGFTVQIVSEKLTD